MNTPVHPLVKTIFNAARTLLLLGGLLLAGTPDLLATSHYVYHEATTNNPGCGANNYRSVLMPGHNQALTIAFKAEYQNYHNQARVYYTTDGSDPAGAFGVPSGTTQVVTGTFSCTFNSGGVVDVVTATIPGQIGGTTVKYIVSAWHTGGGDEIFGNGPSAGCACGTPTNNSSLATVFDYTVPYANTYHYSGTDNWTDAGNWSPSYPGTTLAAGDLLIIDAGSVCTVPTGTTVTVDGDVTADGDLINNGTLLQNGDITILLNGINSVGATWTVSGVNAVFFVENSVTFANLGTMNFTNGNTSENFGTFTNKGSLTVDATSLFTNSALFYNGEAGMANTANLTIHGNFYANAVFLNEDGATVYVSNSGGLDITAFFANNANAIVDNNGLIGDISGLYNNNGLYKGSGAFDGLSFFNAADGNVSPGASPGCQSFTGDFANDISGAINIEITGTTPCIQFDQLQVTGEFTAGGTLNVDFGSFTPTMGQTFQIVTAGTYMGSFTTINETPSSIITSYSNGILTVTGAPSPGAALNFDGTDDLVDLGTGLGNFGTGDFTVETWFKVAPSETGYRLLIAKRGICAHANFWDIVMNAGKIYFEIDENTAGDNYLSIATPLAYNDNNWHHVACTRSGTAMKIYMDGALAVSGNTAAPTNLNNAVSVKVGNQPCGMFAGALDELRIWTEARSCDQINQLRSCELTGSEPNLVAYYKFNHGIAAGDNTTPPINTLTDATANANHGTLTGFALNGATSNWLTPGGVTTGTSCPAVTVPEINVQGNGNDIVDGSVTPSTTDHTDFGNVAVNGSLVRTFTIYNTGNADLTVSTITSSNPTKFVVGALTPVSPISGPSGSATFTVTFLPTALGVENATITINNGDCDEAVYDFVVTGNGATPAAALNFDGTDDYITTANNTTLDLSTQTVELWAKPSGSGDNDLLVGKRNYNAVSANDIRWSIHFKNGNEGLYFFSPAGTADWTYTFTPNQWYHIAMVTDATSTKLYIDGTFISSKATTINSLTNLPVLFGASAPNYEVFPGSLDEVRIWNTARSCDQISQLRSCELTGSESGLMAYYKFNQGFANENNSTVTTLDDATTNNNDGTLSNTFDLTGATSNWVAPGGVTTGTSCPAVTVSEINLQGGSPLTTIPDGDSSPSTAEGTDFGSVLYSGSVVRTFTIQNTGNDAMTISSITSSNAKYGISDVPTSVAANGGSATFTVTFTPAETGTHTATITVNSNDCDEAAYDFAVTGTATFPVTTIGFDCISGAIGNYYNGGSGPNVGIAFPNGVGTGGALDANTNPVINIPAGFTTGFAVQGDVCIGFNINIYSGLDGTGTVLASQGGNPGLRSVAFSGVAKSVSLGRYSCPGTGYDNLTFGSTTIGTSVAESLQEINLQGNGLIILDGDATPATADHTDFGNVFVNGSLQRTFTIQNTGTANLTVSNIASNNTRFAVGALTPTGPIAGGGSATFTVTFNPTATGTQNATITVSNDDCSEAVYDFAVTGKGVVSGAALSFDGVNDDVMIPHSSNITFDLNQDFTVSLHVKIPSSNQPNTGNIDNDIVEKVGAGGGYPYVIRYYNHTAGAGNNGKIIAARWNGSTAAIVTSTVTLNDDTWHHIAFVKNGATLYLYVDGVLNSTTPDLTTGSTANTAPLYLGSRESQINWFNGSMDNLSIWNIARSCEEIRQQSNCELAGSESGLVAYYNFNHGFANENNSGVTTLTDAAGGDNNGTLSNNFALTGTTSNWVTPGGVTTGTSCPAVVAPEADVRGGSPLTTINDGDNMPSTNDGTDFGNVLVNGSLVRTFTIYNTGNADLTINSITSSNNTLFSVGALSQASPIQGGGSATFTVTFLPTATGVQNATITIANNDCDEAVYDFSVTGKGIVPGAALTLDGSNDYVNLGTSAFEFVGSFTIETWVNSTLGSTNIFTQGRIMDKGVAGAEGPALDLYAGIRFISADGGSGQYVITAPTQVPANAWSHIALTIDVANLVGKIYYNGTLVHTQALSGDVAANPSYNLLLGATDGAGSLSNFFNGKLDEFRVWNRVLCQNEIQAQMNCELTGSESGLMIYYNFNQGIAGDGNNGLNTVNDVATGSGHGGTNNGTLTNFALSGSSSNWTAPGGVTSGVSCSVFVAPEADVQGGSPLTTINDGDNMPTTTDGTDFNGTFTRTFTIQNTGTAVLNISSISSSNTRFVVSGALTTVAANGGTATFTVTYNPTDATAQTSTITVNSDDCDEAAYDFVVTATATPAKALHFDGVDDYVTFPTTGLSATEGTISFWVNAAASQPNNSSMLAETGSENTAIFLWSNGSQIYFRAGGVGSQTTALPFTGGSWKHVAMTWAGAGQTAKCYIDGVQVAMFTQTGAASFGPTGYLGRSSAYANGTSNLMGSMDDIRFWNRALCANEISQLMNCEVSAGSDNLQAYFKCDQGFASAPNTGIAVLTDDATAIGGANNGTFFNFALSGGTSNFVAPGGVTGGACSPTFPDINVQGGSPLTTIADGDITPSTTDHTDFGNVAVNGSLVRTFTIYNTGNADLTINSITSSNNTLFSVGALSQASPIQGGGSASFTVTFLPTALGVQNATITINNGDCDEAVYDFVVTGKGATPAAALNFNGVDDYISTSNNTTLDLSTQTVELWAKPGGSGDNDLLVGKRNYNGTGNNDIRWSIHFKNGNQGLYFYSPTGTADWTYAFTPDQWYHIAMVTDATSTKLYIDGTFISSKATIINSPTNLPVLFGASAPNFEVFPGSLDEVRIWNTARTCDQIAQLRNCELTGSEPNLMAYYNFNQGFANEDNNIPTPVNTLTDATANALNGTLNGFALTGAVSNWVAPGGVTTGTSCPSSITYPEINVQGGSPLTSINDGDITPSTADHTDFNGTFARTFTIQNTGTAVLNIGSITRDNTRFAISGAPTTVAANGGTATFTVTYNPTDGTAQTATITVNSDDCDEAAYDFVVTATATPAKALHIGTGDNVHSPSFTAFGTQPTTIEFWAKNESSFAFPLGFAGQYLFLFGGGNLSIRKDFVSDYNTGATVSNTGTVWEHFALTYDGNGTFRAYKNGVPTPNPTHSAAGWGTAYTGTLQIGEPKGGYPYIGAIDEVRMWNEQRTDAQILAAYNTEIASMSPCLQVYWKFNQGFIGANNSSVTTATDDANAVNHNGTLTGFALTAAVGNWVAGSGIAETPSAYVPAPEVNLKGGTGPIGISDGDTSPSTGEGTNFGSVVVNNTTTQTFTIENTGNLQLNVSGVSFTGTNAADFSVTVAPAATVAATNGTTMFTVQFAPTSTGTKTAVMHIANDDCDEADYDIAIQGTASCTAPSFTACPTNQSANVVATTCAAPVSYTATASGTPAPTITYAFSGATVATGSGTGSGSSFNKGTTTVTLTATSTCSPPATCSFTVTVTDNEPPSITCAAPVTINTTANLCTGTTALTLPTYGDNCAGTLGNALHYGGSSEVTAPNTGLPTGNAARTVEFWVKIPSNAQHHIVSWGNFTCAIYPFSGVMRPHLWGSFNDVSSSTLSVPLNTWTHVAYVLTGTQLVFYVNGVADAKTYTHNTGTTGNLAIGTYLGGTGQTVDEVRIWNTVRTQAQIQSTMGAELVGNEAGLVSYYKFNQGIAGDNNAGVTTLNATTGQNGTLTGFLLNGATSNWVQGLTFPTLTNNALSAYPKGTTTVTWTTTDAAGLTATCNQTVTVVDNQAPTLTAPANQSLNVIATTCAANYTIADPIADNCTGATWTYALSGATTAATSSAIADGMDATNVSFNKGVTTVTLNGVDAATNAAVQKTFTVTVTDNEVPKVTACFGTNISAFGQATGNSVTLSSNSTYQSFTAPVTGVITSIQIQLGGGASGLTLRVGDGISCGGNVLGSKVFNGVGGLQTITFDTPIPVTGGVMYNFGIIGNHTAGWATTGTYSGGQFYYNGCPGSPAFPNSDLVFTVNMNYVPPISINVAPGTCAQNYAIPAPTLSDNCTGPLTWNATFSGNANGNPANLTGLADGSPTDMISFSKGTTNVVLNGVDASGNVSTTTCPFTVTVVDDEAPTITCAGPVTINTTPGLCTGTTTLTEPTVTDNCPLVLGNGLHFDGSNDLVNASGLLGASPAQFTVEFWLNPASRSDYNQEISIGSASNGHWNGFTFHTTSTGAVYVGTDIGSRMTPADIPDNTVVLNTWQHFAYVLSGGTGKFYKNGVLLATKANGTPPNFDVLRIASGCCNPVHGVLDELRIWNTARTQAELVAAKNSELGGSEPNLVAYYNFNQGTAGGNNAGLTNLPDAATAISGANNGTLTGFTLSGATSNWVTGVPLNSLSNNAPSTYPKGATIVTWTATDASGNTETCQQTVTVTDNEAPTVACPANTTVINTDAGASCQITIPNYVASLAPTDNCTAGGSILENQTPSAGAYPVSGDGSPVTVTYTATDDAATPNTRTCTVTITVNDDDAPTVTCPANTTVLSPDPGTPCSITIPNYVLDLSPTDNCTAGGSIAEDQTPSAGTYAISGDGATVTVTYTVTDGASPANTTTCTVTITVNAAEINVKGNSVDIADGDTSPDAGDHTDFGSTTGTPITRTFTIQNVGHANLELGPNSITLGGADALLFSIGNITLPTSVGGPNGSITFDVTYAPVGTGTHTATVHIASNDCGEEDYDFVIQGFRSCSAASFTACPTSPVTANNDPNQCYAAVSYTVTADGTPTPGLMYQRSGAVADGGNGTGSGLNFPVGTTLVTVTATNPCSAPTCTFNVVVTDAQKPTFTCPTPPLMLNTTGGANCQVVIPDLVAMVTNEADNCALRTLDPVEQSIAAGNYDGVSDGMTIPVVVTVTDNASPANSETCTVTFTVNDDDAPTVTCPPATATINTDGGSSCSITVPNYVTMLSPTDNCSATVTENQDIPAGSYGVSGHGATVTVNYTATDGASPANTRTCTVVITVNDDDFPSITCPGPQTVPTDPNGCSTSPLTYSVTTTDNCASTATLLSGLPSGSQFPIGMTNVVWKTTDAAGHSTTCAFTVTVGDVHNPSIVCPQNIARNTDANQCTALVAYAAPSVSDNCTGWTLTRTGGPASGSSFPAGMTTLVSWKVTDAGGNEALCQFTVTVTDAQAPAITCPANIVRNTDAGQCWAVVNYTTPTATDNCGVASVALHSASGTASGSQFPKGTTSVVWRATDTATPTANTSTCSFSVTVNDSQVPSIACPSNIVKGTNPGQCYANTTYSTPTASDNCTGVTVALQSGLPSSSNFPKGQTTVVWKATDAAGLTKTCSFRVTVNDTENPVITCPTMAPTTTTANSCISAAVNYSTPTATDNCTTVTVLRLSGPASGSTFPLGSTNVIWRAIDAAGRSSTCSFAVTVTDGTAPMITCPSSMTVSGSGSPCVATVTYTTPTGTDNCGVQSLFLLTGLNSGSVFPAGATVNVWRAIDNAGLSATCSFTVTVGCGAAAAAATNYERGSMNEGRAGATSFMVHGSSFNLSPNPATSEVQISVENLDETGGELRVMDAQGRLMWRQRVGPEALTSTLELDGRWQSGVYFVTLRSGGEVMTKRLVVSRM